MNLIIIADYLGVFVFAISGGLVAIRHNYDVFGILVISLLPAVGGGTLRDVLLDQPVFWLGDPTFIAIGLAGGVVSVVYKSWTKVKLLVWVDSLGLALFAMLGTLKAYSLDLSMIPCVMMGIITATGGGLLRDVVCNEPPLLLKSDIYATAALVGSVTCYTLLGFSQMLPVEAAAVGFMVTFAIRVLVIKYKLSLPTSRWIQNKLYPRG